MTSAACVTDLSSHKTSLPCSAARWIVVLPGDPSPSPFLALTGYFPTGTAKPCGQGSSTAGAPCDEKRLKGQGSVTTSFLPLTQRKTTKLWEGNPCSSCQSSSWRHLFAFALGSRCPSAPNGARAEQVLLSVLPRRCTSCFVIATKAVRNVLAQLQINGEAVPAAASAQFRYTAVDLPREHSYGNCACKLDNEKTKTPN